VAYSINGCGTRICGGRGHLRWGGPPDFDGLECFCLFYLPLVPYRALHTYEWQYAGWWERQRGGWCRSVPIRWTAGLVLRTFARSWLQVPLLAGVMLLVCYFAPTDLLERLFLGSAGLLLVAACGCVWGALWFTDGRNRDVRRVLGPHAAGSSDPATWTADHLDAVRRPKKLFGTRTFADAVEPLLQAGEFSRAMLAARLGVALEGRATGEHLTDILLRDPDVRAALAEVRRDQSRWRRVMNGRQSA
jgi:hypothetical protein